MSERTNEECRLIITTEVVECLSGILNARHRDISLGAVLLVKKNWRIPEIRVSSMRKRERTDLPCRRTVLDGIKRKTSKFTFADEAQHTRGDCSRRSGPIGYYRRSLLFVLDFRDFSKEVLYMVIAELCSIPFWFWKLTRKVIEYLLASPRWNNLSNRTTIRIEFLVGLHKSQNKKLAKSATPATKHYLWFYFRITNVAMSWTERQKLGCDYASDTFQKRLRNDGYAPVLIWRRRTAAYDAGVCSSERGGETGFALRCLRPFALPSITWR